VCAAGIPRSKLTDTLSKKITDLSASIEDNDTLWNNASLRDAVLRSAIPNVRCALLCIGVWHVHVHSRTHTRTRVITARGVLLQTLVTLLGGLDRVTARIPPKYCRAIFGSRLASRFVYQCGLETPEFAFFEFVSKGSL
jgi:glutamate dehydrogenase